MKKSLRLLVGILMLGAMMSATGVYHKVPCTVGADPVPLCPPGGCATN